MEELGSKVKLETETTDKKEAKDGAPEKEIKVRERWADVIDEKGVRFEGKKEA